MPPVLIMERVSPTVHLAVLACVLVATLAALLPLRWRHVRLNSFQDLCRQLQTWITILKCISDIALVVLSALNVSTIVHDGTHLWVSIGLLLHFSITCVIISEHLVVQQIFRQTPFGRFCGPVSFVAIFAFTVLRFLPFIRLYNEALHFWTVFAANFSETLYFSSIYWWTLYQLQSDRKWKSSLTVSAICSSLVSLSTLVALVVGQMYPWIRSPLLSEVFLLLITGQFSLRSNIMERSQAPKKIHGNMLDEVPSEPWQLLNRNTGTSNERPSITSTSRKPLTGDSNDPRELYAFSLSEIQVREKERDEKGEKVIPTDSEVILRMEEEIDGVSAYIPEKPPRSGNLRPSSCSSCMSPPLGWLPQMTDFTKDLLAKDEGPESIVLMLEAEWPQMAGRVEVKWVEFCAWQGQSEELIVEAKEMENTAKLGYDHCKKYKQQEADEIIENWSWWHPELEGGSRVVRHR